MALRANIQASGGKRQVYSKPAIPFGKLFVIVFFTVGEFVLDYHSPASIPNWVWYFIPLILTLRIRIKYFTYFLAATITGLILLVYSISPAHYGGSAAVLTGRFFGIMVVWVLALLITENTRLAESIRERERRYRDLAESSPDAILIWNQDSIFLYANQRAAGQLGLAPAQVIGRSRADFFPQELVAADQLILNRVFREGQPESRERIMPFKAGDRWIETRFIPLFNEMGTVEAVMGISRDQTERRQLEDSHRRNEERYRQLAESSPDAIFIVDQATKFQYANQTLADWIGRPAPELNGQVSGTFFPMEVAQEQGQMLQAVFATGTPASYERQRPFNQVLKWIEVRLVPLRNNQGTVESVMGIVRDITDRKLRDESLRLSEARFRQLAENIDEVFWISNAAKNEIIYVSPAYEKIWARSCASLYRTPFEWADAIHPEDRARMLLAICQKQIIGTYDEEYRVIRPDGKIRWIHDRAFPIKDESGQVYRIVGIAADITQRHQLQNRLLEIVEHERNRLGQDLHDGLAQHLVGIGFAFNLLGKDLSVVAPQLNARLSDLSAKIYGAIGMTRELARGLHTTELKNHGLAAALQNLCETTGRDFNLKCAFDGAAGLNLKKQEVATHLYRIAQEAVHNAVKHAHAREIMIRLKIESGRMVLTVADDGIGLVGKFEPGMGMEIMRYRAGVIGGQFEVSRAPTGGVIITCSLSLELAE